MQRGVTLSSSQSKLIRLFNLYLTNYLPDDYNNNVEYIKALIFFFKIVDLKSLNFDEVILPGTRYEGSVWWHLISKLPDFNNTEAEIIENLFRRVPIKTYSLNYMPNLSDSNGKNGWAYLIYWARKKYDGPWKAALSFAPLTLGSINFNIGSNSELVFFIKKYKTEIIENIEKFKECATDSESDKKNAYTLTLEQHPKTFLGIWAKFWDNDDIPLFIYFFEKYHLQDDYLLKNIDLIFTKKPEWKTQIIQSCSMPKFN